MAIASIFTPAANDQSIYYLSQIFPGLNAVLTGTAPKINVIGSLFQVLNSVVLTIAGFMITYTIIMGLLATAHEGEFLGKKFDKLWTPLRIVLGVAGLVPMSSGYSGIQVIMMWVIVQGIGVADVMWTTTLNYTNQYGITGEADTPLTIQVQAAMEGLFKGLVCQESARKSSSGYYCGANPKDLGFCGMQQSDLLNIISGPQATKAIKNSKSTLTYSMGPQGGACGALKICGDSTPECLAQQQVLQQITSTVLAPIAAQLVDMNYNYQNFYDNSYQIVDPPKTGATYTASSRPGWITAYCSGSNIGSCCHAVEQPDPTNPNKLITLGVGCGVTLSPTTTGTPPAQNIQVVNDVFWKYGFSNINTINFIGASIQEYNAAMQQVQQAVLQSSTTQTKDQFKAIQSYGWIYAGASYYIVAKANNVKTDSIVNLTLSSDSSEAPLSGVTTNLDAANALIKLTESVGADSGGSSSSAANSVFVPSAQAGSSGDPILNFLNSLASEIMRSFQRTLTGAPGSNPLIEIQKLGHGILVACEVTFYIALAASLGLIIAGGIASITALGTGAPGFSTTVLNILIIVVPLLMGFLTMFMAIGGMLGVYVPLIPFIMFTTGAIGWLIGVIEAMVAGPLVALGMLSPSANHHEILGKAEPALGLLFGIFLRPGLMVFGMILGLLLSMQVVTLVNGGFFYALSSTTGTAKPGLIELIMYMGAYAMLIISAMNKCFSLIHVIPEKVLSWISIQGYAGGGGEQEALQGVKGGVEGAGGMASSVSGGATSKGMEKGREGQGDMKQRASSDAGAARQKKEKEEEDTKKGPNMTGKKG